MPSAAMPKSSSATPPDSLSVIDVGAGDLQFASGTQQLAVTGNEHEIGIGE